LAQAFSGVEQVFLISTHAFADRETEHSNVIRAAEQAGVRHVLYNPVIQKVGSTFDLVHVTQPDRFTIDLLKKSGLAYTLMAQPPFLESLEFIIGDTAAGLRVPAGDGQVAPAARNELAEAQAVVLASSGHEGKSYDLTGGPAISFADLARTLSEVHNKHIPYVPLSEPEYLGIRTSSGLPGVVAEFALGWARGVNSGEWSFESGDLQRLIGRRPMTVPEFFTQSTK
jgi:NAD(P)H dehydrogenase (quinone)